MLSLTDFRRFSRFCKDDGWKSSNSTSLCVRFRESWICSLPSALVLDVIAGRSLDVSGIDFMVAGVDLFVEVFKRFAESSRLAVLGSSSSASDTVHFDGVFATTACLVFADDFVAIDASAVGARRAAVSIEAFVVGCFTLISLGVMTPALFLSEK